MPAVSDKDLILLVIRCLVAVLGTALLLYALSRFWKAQRAARRPTVPGQVREATVLELYRPRVGWRYRAQVAYAYAVGGEELLAHRVFYGDELWATRRAEADAVVQRYPVGETVTVRYDPAHPADAVLETGVSRRILVTGVVGLVLALGAWWLPLR